MAPRKKSSSSSSKKSNQNQQQSQPSKFGIQHFFERHTQNSQKPKNVQTSQTSNPINQPQVTPPSNLPTISPAANTVTSITTTSTEDEICEVSPEISKSGSFKRYKFSPGMLIKQSQDDGAERVSWRISPVNVKAVTKRKPETIRVLADASKLNASNFRHCSNKESSISVEEWISSPILKAPERSLVFSKEDPLREVDPNQDVETHSSYGSGNDQNKTNTVRQRNPFQTPPSASYCLDEPIISIVCKGASDQLGPRQNKKSLLELLDQVGDAISVEDLVTNNTETHFEAPDTKDDNISVKSNPLVKIPQIVDSGFSDPFFLVLEVSEKHNTSDSSCVQCPVKVLRLLNEQNGEERALHLHDEWFYSVIGPGDTIHVIGEFDDQGKCVVDHDNNLFILHTAVGNSGCC